MKTIKILASFLILFLTVQVSYGQCGKDNPIKTVQYKVNANSDDCKTIIETALNETDGVQSSSLDISTSILTVKFDSKIIKKVDVAKVVTDKGYTANQVNNQTQYRPHNCNHPCGHH